MSTPAAPGGPPGAGRLRLAALLCLLSLGLVWGTPGWTAGYVTPGVVLPTSDVSPVTGEVSIGSQYVAGVYVPGGTLGSRGYQADARAVLVPAALALAVAATRRTPATRRAARIVLAALGLLVLVAVSRAATAAAATTVLAVVLATPVAWPELVGRRRA